MTFSRGRPVGRQPFSWLALPYGLSLIVLHVIITATVAVQGSPVVASVSSGRTVSLSRRAPVNRTPADWGLWAKNQKEILEAKHGISSQQSKRASGDDIISNQNADSSYFGSIAVGTPSTLFNVILDTGSSDLWLATSEATQAIPGGIRAFDPSVSTTFTPLNTSFSIQYGSGSASGQLGTDTVQFAGFEVENQVFGIVSNVTGGLLDEPVSGLLGLAFQDIATSGTSPFWLSVVDSAGTLNEPLMAFQLTRFINDSGVQPVEIGGTFTIGSTNSSLYTGDIEYQEIPSDAIGYWTIPLRSVDIQNVTLNASANSSALAAIDTGTTLVGGPPDMIQEMFSTIPGSQPGNGTWESYYTYPCNTSVSVSLSFGSSETAWPVSPSDFKLIALDADTCVGAFFMLSPSNTGPSWIVGDTFLKNVYSVFRAEPPSVGFAELSETALSMNGANLPLPSPTAGTPEATVTAISSAIRTLPSNISPVIIVNICASLFTAGFLRSWIS